MQFFFKLTLKNYNYKATVASSERSSNSSLPNIKTEKLKWQDFFNDTKEGFSNVINSNILKILKDGKSTLNQTSKFEVEIEGGGVIFSKLEKGRFPNEEDMENIYLQIIKMFQRKKLIIFELFFYKTH